MYNVRRSGQFLEKEIFKYTAADEIKHSIVLDAVAFPMPADREARNIVPAGTILKLSVTDPKKHVVYDGSGRVEGILGPRSIEIGLSATAGVAPATLVRHNAIFATAALVGFTAYASAVVSTLNTCKFE